MFTKTVGVLLLVAFISGCGSEVVSSTDDHDPFHEHDHHTPAHRPADLAAAVESLRTRQKQLDDAKIAAPDMERLQNELLDIIRWLPEIAGDSDLPETPWNVVDSHSTELQRIAAQTKDLHSPSFRQALHEAVNDVAEIARTTQSTVALSGE